MTWLKFNDCCHQMGAWFASNLCAAELSKTNIPSSEPASLTSADCWGVTEVRSSLSTPHNGSLLFFTHIFEAFLLASLLKWNYHSVWTKCINLFTKAVTTVQVQYIIAISGFTFCSLAVSLIFVFVFKELPCVLHPDWSLMPALLWTETFQGYIQ